jgi:hypothetical protein
VLTGPSIDVGNLGDQFVQPRKREGGTDPVSVPGLETAVVGRAD